MPPTVDLTSIDPYDTSADFYGYVQDAGSGESITDEGFVYSATDNDPILGAGGVTQASVGAGFAGSSYGTTVTGLTIGTLYYVKAYASNELALTGYSAVQSFRACPVDVEISRPAAGFVGVPYSFTLTTTGLTGALTYSVESGPLPADLTLNGDTIEGTPASTGKSWVEIKVTSANGCHAVLDFCFTVGTPIVPGSVLISEFRLRGPFGARDEYFELANTTDSDIVVAASDSSDGWSLGAGKVVTTIPNGTVIPSRGHWLATGCDFSLWDYPAGADYGIVWDGDTIIGDQGDSCDEVDVPDDAGVGLFTTSASGTYSTDNRLDAVGSTAETNDLFFEGEGVPAIGSDDLQYAWVRITANNGELLDAQNNSRDFVLVSVQQYCFNDCTVDSILGGPSPESTISPVNASDDELKFDQPEPLPRKAEQEPNRHVNRYQIQYRLKVTNTGPEEVALLRFKAINMTTYGSPGVVPPGKPQGRLQFSSVDDDAESFFAEGQGHYLYGTWLDDEQIYPRLDYDWDADSYRYVGGVNSTVSVDFGVCGQSETFLRRAPRLASDETVYVNLQALVGSTGYYIFLVVPQIAGCPEGPPKRQGLVGPRGQIRR